MRVRLEALLEVGPSVFFSLLVIAVAFVPVFTLVDQEGRLFKPLAYSKNLAMAIAALLAITLDPAMRMLFARVEPFSLPAAPAGLAGEQRCWSASTTPRSDIPSAACFTAFTRGRVVSWSATRSSPWPQACCWWAPTVPVYLKLGSEFMPPLREGSLLYMPSAVQPGMSVSEAQKALQVQDKILMTFPEVERVFGKAGRAGTSTDPAPFSMMETTILLKPESQWRGKQRWYSAWAPEPGSSASCAPAGAIASARMS